MASHNKVFDWGYYRQRNKEVALAKYGGRLDGNRNIKGTDYYFDNNWCLCKKEGAE